MKPRTRKKIERYVESNTKLIASAAIGLAEREVVSLREVIVMIEFCDGAFAIPFPALRNSFSDFVKSAVGPDTGFQLPRHPPFGSFLVIVFGRDGGATVLESFLLPLIPSSEIKSQQQQKPGELLVEVKKDELTRQYVHSADLAVFDLIDKARDAGSAIRIGTKQLIGRDLHYQLLRLDFFDVAIRWALPSENARYIAVRRGPTPTTIFVRKIDMIDIEAERALRSLDASMKDFVASKDGAP